jgi:hypothetical protein
MPDPITPGVSAADRCHLERVASVFRSRAGPPREARSSPHTSGAGFLECCTLFRAWRARLTSGRRRADLILTGTHLERPRPLKKTGRS